jgi:hypothetical protein
MPQPYLSRDERIGDDLRCHYLSETSAKEKKKKKQQQQQQAVQKSKKQVKFIL